MGVRKEVDKKRKKRTTPNTVLSDNQKEVIKSKQSLIKIFGRVGYGKTMASIGLIRDHFDENCNTRVLFITDFDKVDETIDMLRSFDIPIVNPSSEHALDTTPGCRVVTIRTYLRYIRCTLAKSYLKALTSGCQSHEQWDLLIIDQISSDVGWYDQLVNQIVETSEQTVLINTDKNKLNVCIWPGEEEMICINDVPTPIRLKDIEDERIWVENEVLQKDHDMKELAVYIICYILVFIGLYTSKIFTFIGMIMAIAFIIYWKTQGWPFLESSLWMPICQAALFMIFS
jgi:ATP:corrinoid adenosyltransferase